MKLCTIAFYLCLSTYSSIHSNWCNSTIDAISTCKSITVEYIEQQNNCSHCLICVCMYPCLFVYEYGSIVSQFCSKA